MDYQSHGLECIKALSWDKVFAIWRKTESNSERMQKLWKDRGYKSWEEWRIEYVRPLKLQQLTWKLYHARKPTETLPNFYGGPYKSWVQFVYGANKFPRISDLIATPYIQQNEQVKDMMFRFPDETTIIAVTVEDRITVIEGMHRCCAIALAEKQDKKITANVHVAIAEHCDAELPIVGGRVSAISK